MSPGRLYRDVAPAVIEITRAGLAPPELFAQAGEVLKAAAGFTASCWETLDPVTLLPTSGVTENLPKASAPAYFENEYLHEDFNKFDELLSSDVPACSAARPSPWTGGSPTSPDEARTTPASTPFGARS